MRPPLALLCCCIAGPLAAGPPPATEHPRARCAALVALFDQVIVSRFDYRILMLENYELDHARELRRGAEAECRAGSDTLGLELIESALREIGVVPPMTDAAESHD